MVPKVERVELACKQCRKPFFMLPGVLSNYQSQHNRQPMYCSRTCTGLARRISNEASQVFNCLSCGKENPRRKYDAVGRTKFYSQQKYCNQQCQYDHRKVLALERFENGEIARYTKARNGYVHVHIPSLVTGKKHSVLEHRFNMSRHLGRDLTSEETVHHRDGNRANNDLSNLELFTSRHGPGQRVVDQVSFAIDMLNLYPEFARAAGYQLVKLE